MIILNSDYLMTCDDGFNIYDNIAIAFDDKIKEIGKLEDLTKSYPDAEVVQCKPNSLIMPGLTNIHLHLEFSANKSTLKYGDFMQWLDSVIEHRDDLSSKCDEKYIDSILDDVLKSGTTTIGAISSFGTDLSSCVKSPLNVIYFNEVLGSNPAAVDALYSDFLGRLEMSQMHKCDSFTPAISVHSPYSTHPILAKKALSVAKQHDLVVSTHFMESKAERDWLDSGDGDFKKFFANFDANAKPINDGVSYLELFKDQKVFFTHATKANDEEIEIMNHLGSITHSPVSNRLLGNGRLDINRVKNLSFGTDGLSSNNSLNLWDEMRMSLMLHCDADINELAKTLLLASTTNPAKTMKTNKGSLEQGKDSDLIVIELPEHCKVQDLPLHVILHTKKADKVYIKGKQKI